MDGDLLAARELRWRVRRELAAIHRRAVVSATLRAPHDLRSRGEFICAHRCLCGRLGSFAAGKGVPFRRVLETLDAEGPCVHFLAEEAWPAKDICVRFEDEEQGGELLDADVMDAAGEPLSRGEGERESRRCAVCGRAPARECILSHAHTGEETAAAFVRLAGGVLPGTGAALGLVAEAALRAVLYEVAVTPKPGLVDRLGNGAHRDMGFYTFLDGACALAPYFHSCAQLGAEFAGDAEGLLPLLRVEGIAAEKEMLRATAGVNTHRGTIFALGILCAAAGRLAGRGRRLAAADICELAGEIARPALSELAAAAEASAHGMKVFQALGAAGARGEAAAGFPSALRKALPALRGLLGAGKSIDEAGTAALLELMSSVEDTNVLHRAGAEGLQMMRREAGRLLREGAGGDGLAALGRRLEDSNISPGGCADLLAAAFFLHFTEAIGQRR